MVTKRSLDGSINLGEKITCMFQPLAFLMWTKPLWVFEKRIGSTALSLPPAEGNVKNNIWLARSV